MNSNQLPLSGGIAVFFAVIIGYFVIDPSALDGFRPGGDSRDIPQVHGIEDVQARLWQDPFAAAAQHQRAEHAKDKVKQFQLSGKVEVQPKGQNQATTVGLNLKPMEIVGSSQAENSNRHSFKELNRQIRRKWEDVDLLGVMVSGGPYPENSEIRLRKRYAVIAGLAASGYQPEEAAHIGYVDDLGDAKCGEGEFGAGKMPKIMPFEWFQHESGKYILLIWLDEDTFSNYPLCKLNKLFLNDGKGANGGTSQTFSESNIEKTSIIGPHGSGTLKAMLLELKERSFPSLQQRVAFYSATATAESIQLVPKNPVEDSSQKKWDDPVARAFLSKEIILFRTIADDRKLTDQLIKSIVPRLQDNDEEKEVNFQVALVSEWDTLYGRALPQAFEASSFNYFKPEEPKDDWVKNHVYRFGYLRGIDGKISKSKGKTGKEESDSTGIESKSDRKIERPEGTSQKDYLRRLASDMVLTHQKLKNEGRKGIRAIGVLGSDVYDKLLILRALRKQFPKAIFFTTDLDAALLHPDQFQWARNLLVASSFDLKIASRSEIEEVLRREDFRNKDDSDSGQKKKRELLDLIEATQRAIPENRDVYQTSVFLSTILAAKDALIDNFDRLMDENVTAFESEQVKAVKNIIKAALPKEIIATQENLDDKEKEISKKEKEISKKEKEISKKEKEISKKEALAKERAEISSLYETLSNFKTENNELNKEIGKLKNSQRDIERRKNTLEKVRDALKNQDSDQGDEWITSLPAGVYYETQRSAADKVEIKLIPRLIQQAYYQTMGRYIDPRVYEVGREGAVELERDESSKDSLNPLYPAMPSPVSPRGLVMISSSRVLFMLLAFFFWRRWMYLKAGCPSVKNKRLANQVDRRAAYIGILALTGIYICQKFGNWLFSEDGDFLIRFMFEYDNFLDAGIYFADPINAFKVWIPTTYVLLTFGLACLVRKFTADLEIVDEGGEK